MSKVNPYHAARSDVYHVYDRECHVGNNIEKRNKQPGKGGKRLCSRCKILSTAKRGK
jgi:hypothetical protein